jgi:hypothetical protein
MPFSPNSSLYSKNYPRNINYIPVYPVICSTYLTGAVIFYRMPRFWKKLLFSDSLPARIFHRVQTVIEVRGLKYLKEEPDLGLSFMFS